METVVEMAPFRVVPGVTEQQVLEASKALQQDFLNRQQGFIKRELLKGKNEGEWLDIVHWQNDTSAQEAMQHAMNSPACGLYFQLMQQADSNDSANGVRHFKSVAIY